MEKPTLPKGTRDFGPAVMAKRQFIFETIRSVFQKFGFQPLETPAMENLSTLTGKYGDEGDQLLFRILNSGDFKKNAESDVELLIGMSGTQLREFFDAVYQSKMRGSSIPEAVKEEFVSLRTDNWPRRKLISLSLPKIEKSINEWIEASLSLPVNISNLDFLQELNRIRNIKVSELIEILKLNISTEFEELLESYYCEKGLRYDLTVPFARFVVMNRNEIAFPFKRYQIQPVWRGDTPQQGRYREFYQCDADVVGTDSLICEAEIILMITEVFKGLGITDYTIKINHRGILSGIAETIDAKQNETSLFVAIDKLDKAGEEKVKEELKAKGFSEESLTTLFNILHVKGTTTNKIGFLQARFDTSESGQKGLRDLQEVFNLLESYNASDNHVEFDVSLARGLSYYTGCIFEVKIHNVPIGSVSGGGRYDNLTQAFGDKQNLSGVGFSFGVDRIYDCMEKLQLFPKTTAASSQVLVCHFDDDSRYYGLGVLSSLRGAGIASEIYPDQVKLKKQLDFANKKGIPFVVVIGSEETQSGQLAFKDMNRGEQEKLPLYQIIQKIKQS